MGPLRHECRRRFPSSLRQFAGGGVRLAAGDAGAALAEVVRAGRSGGGGGAGKPGPLAGAIST
jgi:hypothetical protein